MESSEDDFLYNSDDYFSIDNCDSFDEIEDDEIDNCDSLDETEENIDDNLRLKEKTFTILGEEDIRLLQEDAIANTGAVLGVSREAALVLLLHHKWRINEVHDKWFADQERVRKAVGLLENPVVECFQVNVVSDSRMFSCKICMEKLPMDKSISVACGHPFCHECWRTYIRISISDGLGCLMLKCPEPSCGAAVGQDMVNRLVLEQDTAKYSSYLVRSYVEENKKMKWCPAPGCDCAIEFVFGSETYDVTCSCSYSFCWNCTEAAHRPVDCDTVTKWMLKNSSESENMKWILAYSKLCPNCKRPIEKNQGCMHMICSMCKYEFCWLCLGNWTEHGTEQVDYYDCNRYREREREGTLDDDERRRQLSKEALDKYLHYYERWAANQSAMSKAEMELKQMQDVNLEMLRAKYYQPQSQIVFILEAWKQIVECRRVLKWSYAYGYYLPDEEKTKKQFFEYLQGEAESALEKLHHYTEKEIMISTLLESSTENPTAPTTKERVIMSFQEFRKNLLDLTRVTKNYFENLVKTLENGLADVES